MASKVIAFKFGLILKCQWLPSFKLVDPYYHWITFFSGCFRKESATFKGLLGPFNKSKLNWKTEIKFPVYKSIAYNEAYVYHLLV